MPHWRMTIARLAVIFGCAAASAEDAPREKLHVYLLIGQSNMAGRAAIGDDEGGPLERCVLLNAQGAWEPASNPLNKHSTIRKGLEGQKLSPGYTFAKAMAASAGEGVTIGLVVNARGGSYIAQWAKGTPYYNDAVARTKQACRTGVLKGICWHQGESDRENADYLDALKTLIADLRADLGESNVPFVAGEIHDVPLINDQLRRLPQEAPHAAVARADNLKTTDRWHFDAPSVRTLGERYAEAMRKLHAEGGEQP